jgi:arylsulfatase A-like enzyme
MSADRYHGAQAGMKPNILFIVVDELRYPSVFPNGIHDVGGFLRRFMPATHRLLWQRGVKFAAHFTAGVACSPARGTLVTGLYSQQSWLLATILDSPSSKVSLQPVLSRVYPTYGKLLRRAGYETPQYRQMASFDPAQPSEHTSQGLWF